jgi:hypothetical protein
MGPAEETWATESRPDEVTRPDEATRLDEVTRPDEVSELGQTTGPGQTRPSVPIGAGVKVVGHRPGCPSPLITLSI